MGDDYSNIYRDGKQTSIKLSPVKVEQGHFFKIQADFESGYIMFMTSTGQEKFSTGALDWTQLGSTVYTPLQSD